MFIVERGVASRLRSRMWATRTSGFSPFPGRCPRRLLPHGCLLCPTHRACCATRFLLGHGLDGSRNGYADEAGRSGNCKIAASCAPGEEETTPLTSSSDRECEPCPPGSFSTQVNSLCTLHTACVPGEEELAEAMPNKDRQVRTAAL